MYELKDNFLNKIEFEAVEQTILNTSFPWYLNRIVDDSDYSSESTYPNLMLANILYFKDAARSDRFPNFTCLLDKLDIFSLLRVKINYLTPTAERIIHDFHIDITDDNAPKNIKTAIFYLNTNNGVTVFEDTKKEVKSVKNRMIIFPMLSRHAGTTHTEQDIPHRIVINFNYF